MNISEYTYLLNHPDAVSAKDTDELDKIVTEFPYFQSARALRLKGLYKEDSFRYNYALKVTAAYTNDRSVLFDFITSNQFESVNKHIFEEKKQEILDIAVLENADENVAEADAPTIAESDTFTPEPEVTFEPELTSESEPEITSEPGVSAELQPDTIEEEPATSLPDPATLSILDSIREASVQYTVVEPGEAATEEVVESETEIEPEVETASAETEKLGIGKPLDFGESEMHSFHEWLQLSSFQPVQRDTDTGISEATAQPESGLDEDRQKKNELIDRFIENNPKIPPVKKETIAPILSVEPSRAVDNSYLMTETLARVYLEQKKYDKAIQAYEILILKYPEKSSFFADRILDIRTLKNNNN